VSPSFILSAHSNLGTSLEIWGPTSLSVKWGIAIPTYTAYLRGLGWGIRSRRTQTPILLVAAITFRHLFTNSPMFTEYPWRSGVSRADKTPASWTGTVGKQNAYEMWASGYTKGRQDCGES
jgi:hypothetical protein